MNNRDIKFRARSKETGEVFQQLYNGQCFQWLHEGQNIIIEQYTGLKDKNGVEIYERCVLDNCYVVDSNGADYVLIDISSGDTIRLSDYYKGCNGDVEVTREYREI